MMIGEKKVALSMSGGNITLEQLKAIFERGRLTTEPMTRREIELNMASSMTAVDAVQMAAEAYAAGEGLDPDGAHYLALALREALVNAVKHGHKDDVSRRIQISLRTDARRNLVFTVTDGGAGFDPDGVPDPLAEENLVRGSGRGVFYIRNFVDEVSFTFPKKGGTVVRLKKRLPRLPR